MDPAPVSPEAQAIDPQDVPSPQSSDEEVSGVTARLAPMALGPVAVRSELSPRFHPEPFSQEPQVPAMSRSEDNSPPGGVSVFAMNLMPDLLERFRPDKWIKKFLSNRGNEYFCEIDEEYLTDRFNLTGLNAEVPYYQHALDLITDVFDIDADDQLREQIDKSASHLYGLVHARYIVTTRGLAKMAEKYRKGDFGKCPRLMCEAQPLLPAGQADIPNTSTVKLYCPKCEDLYNPKSSRHAAIDGAYFGTTFHSMLFQVHPSLVPEKSIRRYEPKIYGFRVHALAALARWQDQYREETKSRLKEAGVDVKYAEETDDDEREDSSVDSEEEGDKAGAKDEAKGTDVKGENVLGDAASGKMDIGN